MKTVSAAALVKVVNLVVEGIGVVVEDIVDGDTVVVTGGNSVTRVGGLMVVEGKLSVKQVQDQNVCLFSQTQTFHWVRTTAYQEV